MLDKAATAGLLRKRLQDAYDKWSARDPKRSKAEVARQCAALAERPCTPQTVNAWFKTGRMDKMWLPILEKVLGQSLGFGGGSASADSLDLSSWPFEMIDIQKIMSLKRDDALRIEGVILDAAGRLHIDIAAKAPSTDGPQRADAAPGESTAAATKAA